ncbi:MAG: ADP-ribosylglycohydrolase family protein [Isosphaeraceae bacterium]
MQATSTAIFLARNRVERWEIREEIDGDSITTCRSRSIKSGLPTPSPSCAGTVPPAIVAFLESHDFESAVRLAVSLGGDCDTLACIAGAIAGAYFGVPGWIREQAVGRLDEHLAGMLAEFEERYPTSARSASESGESPPTPRRID